MSWDEAMNAASQGLKQVVNQYGPAPVAQISEYQVCAVKVEKQAAQNLC